jgi:hypothetical protein
MSRAELIEKIERKLGARKLLWFGTRGEDARALLCLPQFSECFSLIAPLKSLSSSDCCLEVRRNRRIDLDSYSLDEDLSEEARVFRRCLLESLQERTVIVPYRPLRFLSSVYYPRSGHVDYLGLFHERQAPFEHKPWVESELQRNGIRTIPWRYFADEERERVIEFFESCLGKVVTRTIRTDGGAGFKVIRTPRELDERWGGAHAEGFFAAAPLLHPHIPINVNACLFADGSVSFHAPSIQLIGLTSCTNRPCGYCGNDFAVPRELGLSFWDEMEVIVLAVAKWLAEKGYLGAFGVDAIIYENVIYLTEVNPRFQGSSAVAATLDETLGRADVFLCHIAAFLGISGADKQHLRDLVREQPAVSQIICHNTADHAVCRVGAIQPVSTEAGYSLIPVERIEVETEAILFKKIVNRSVTADGLTLRSGESGDIALCVESNFAAVQMDLGWEKKTDACRT